jgi:hypothetical protein
MVKIENPRGLGLNNLTRLQSNTSPSGALPEKCDGKIYGGRFIVWNHGHGFVKPSGPAQARRAGDDLSQMNSTTDISITAHY